MGLRRKGEGSTMSVSFADVLALSPQICVLFLAAVVLVVLVLCGTFLIALRVSDVKSTDSVHKAAAIASLGDALKAFVFWRRK
ncbi:hypothetical protein MTP06_04630 [Streptomyces sp. PLM4]|nr:hypothetical protein MTP06_04630 [Streptomyces sp. PLM4]